MSRLAGVSGEPGTLTGSSLDLRGQGGPETFSVQRRGWKRGLSPER